MNKDFYEKVEVLSRDTGLYIPRRDFELTKFYERVLEKYNVVGVELDVKGRMIVFHVEHK